MVVLILLCVIGILLYIFNHYLNKIDNILKDIKNIQDNVNFITEIADITNVLVANVNKHQEDIKKLRCYIKRRLK